MSVPWVSQTFSLSFHYWGIKVTLGDGQIHSGRHSDTDVLTHGGKLCFVGDKYYGLFSLKNQLSSFQEKNCTIGTSAMASAYPLLA